MKALLALPESDVPRKIDPIAIDQYLTFGYVPHPRTILEGTNKLPPAHYAVWRDGRLTVDRYWHPDWNHEVDRPAGEDVEELRSTLTDAVREQMVADVPLGAFLSGGIDSTIIVGLMQKLATSPVKTFAIGFDDPAYDETSYASLAAKHLGTDHQTFIIVEPRAWAKPPVGPRPSVRGRADLQRRQLGTAEPGMSPRKPGAHSHRPRADRGRGGRGCSGAMSGTGRLASPSCSSECRPGRGGGSDRRPSASFPGQRSPSPGSGSSNAWSRRIGGAGRFAVQGLDDHLRRGAAARPVLGVVPR